MTTFAHKTAALVFATGLGAAALGAAAPAFAQPAAEFDPQSAVGHWLYDSNGELVGSVYAVADGGRTVIVQYGTYLTPGRHLVAVPSADLAEVAGHATLRTMTADALAAAPATN
ncbi:MAG TPA: hypothetical protein VJY39_19205 [Acidisphaera sp.]|nr:hypothetical protein [Acidisphaera sp.]HME20907.1 hypothetical protein [Acetobacteraceae bacterium]